VKEAILRAADDLIREILGISRRLHDDPEPSGEEDRAAEFLTARLEAAGFEVEPGVAGLRTAFVARRSGRSGSPRVALLAEYDALPGIGHGCGHNLIAAAGVGAALALARAADGGTGPGLPGDLLVIGTPAEETIGGKIVMVREGVFDGLDAAMMVHPSIEWRVFTDSLTCVSLEVTYLGREAHAVVSPEKGINALDALIQLFIAVDTLRKRLGDEVRIPGVILEGGVVPNVVPARAVGAFTLRTPTSRMLAEVRADVERTARAIGEGTGCEVGIRQTDDVHDAMLTNEVMARRFKTHLAALGVETVDGPRRNKGSLDMGNVSRALPSIHPFIEVTGPETPLHSARFAEATTGARAEEALMKAVKAMALTAHDLMGEPGLLEQAKAEFSARRAEEVAP
jgi:amidohydrolase